MKAPEKLTLTQRIWVENQPTALVVAINKLNVQSKEKDERAEEFISVSKELRAAETEIKLLNQHLEERVTERTSELTEANKALEAFSYHVSHDLRAPVRAVMSFTKIIQQEYGAHMGPKLRELFGYISDSIKRLSAIIEDLLNLSKYGKEKLKIAPVDMAQLIRNAWANIALTTPNHAVLELGKMPIVHADASMMEQVVINLLSNAIKYSSKKEKPLITIRSEQKKKLITFYFKDNGSGFDMSQGHRLFGAFERLHGINEFEGTGVGLALVKSIIHKHGGTVGAEGIVDEGATFYFTLPCRKK